MSEKKPIVTIYEDFESGTPYEVCYHKLLIPREMKMLKKCVDRAYLLMRKEMRLKANRENQIAELKREKEVKNATTRTRTRTEIGSSVDSGTEQVTSGTIEAGNGEVAAGSSPETASIGRPSDEAGARSSKAGERLAALRSRRAASSEAEISQGVGAGQVALG